MTQQSEHPAPGEDIPTAFKKGPPRIPAYFHDPDPVKVTEPYDAPRDLYRLFWPVASWLTLLMNMAIMTIVLADMLMNGYNFVSHIMSILVLTVSFAVLASVYRWILPHGPENIEKLQVGDIQVKYNTP